MYFLHCWVLMDVCRCIVLKSLSESLRNTAVGCLKCNNPYVYELCVSCFSLAKIIL